MEPPRPRSIRPGAVTLMVFHVPVRFTSTTSRKVRSGSGSGPPTGKMPALATTMSAPWPSCSSPRASASRRLARSRTSATKAAIRPPAFSTRLTVSSRSRLVAMGAGTVAICPQRSIAMTSAPSSANLTAWDRPCPRAAPVMNATLPASRLVMAVSLRRSKSSVARQVTFVTWHGAVLDGPDLECERLREGPCEREIPAHEPETVEARSAPDPAQFALAVQAPDRAAPVRDAVAEEFAGGLPHVLVAGRIDHQVRRLPGAVGVARAVGVELDDLSTVLDLDATVGDQLRR